MGTRLITLDTIPSNVNALFALFRFVIRATHLNNPFLREIEELREGRVVIVVLHIVKQNFTLPSIEHHGR
jgi:hypothetical protein